MKYLVVVGDGMPDHPLAELAQRTPLEAASTPHFDFLAREGVLGQAFTVPTSLPPGSDAGNLSVLGYDPEIYLSGRGPLEAGSMGVQLGPQDVAYRCNVVTLEDGLMKDYSAGHITSEEACELVEAVADQLGESGLQFHPGVSYRHLMVHQDSLNGAQCTPPHDIIGEPFEPYLPKGEGQEFLHDLIRRSWKVLESHPVNWKRIAEGKSPANSIWLWGQGYAPTMQSYAEKYSIRGAAISAVDLLRGIAHYAGLDVIDVPGATGYLDTNYSGKASYALDALSTYDFVFVHIEAPDEASHAGNVAAKIEAIEAIDSKVVGPMLSSLAALPDYRLMLISDHPTPVPVRTHVHGPVPFAVLGTDIASQGIGSFSERAASTSPHRFERGHELMGTFLHGQFS